MGYGKISFIYTLVINDVSNCILTLCRIQEHMKERHEEVEEDRREGEELQKLAVQFHIEKERLDNIKRDEKLQMMKDNMSQINDRQMIKKVMEQQEDVSVRVTGQCQLGGRGEGSDHWRERVSDRSNW